MPELDLVLDTGSELLDAIYADVRALNRRIDRLGSVLLILSAATPALTPEQCQRILELLDR